MTISPRVATGYAEKAKQPVHHQRETVLFSSTITETKRESLPIDERSRHEIYSRDADVLGSGSGEDTALTPTTTFIPSIYIELTLRIAPDDYEKDRETIDEKVVEVVQDYQTVPRKRAAVEDRNVELQHDSEKSKESETVLRMLVTDNESGEQNVEATAELYRALDSDRETVYALIKNATQIVSWRFSLVFPCAFVMHHDSQSDCRKWWI